MWKVVKYVVSTGHVTFSLLRQLSVLSSTVRGSFLDQKVLLFLGPMMSTIPNVRELGAAAVCVCIGGGITTWTI